jgi:hypothetical protein
MKSFHSVNLGRGGKLDIRGRRNAVLPLVLLALSIAVAKPALGQVKESAEVGGVMLSAGGSFSGYYVGYGQRELLGPTAFVDATSRVPLGVEAEARWLKLNETADVHDETYLIGPRFAFKELGRFQPYAKVLFGVGQFTFPYNYAHGTYFVVAPGAGCDFRVNHRIYLRLADFEYQDWPQFTYGAIPSYGISSGIRIRLFSSR